MHFARLLVVLAVLALCIGGAVALGGGKELATNVYKVRISERVGAPDSPELAALHYLQEHPGSLLTGTGLGNASFVLRPYFDPRYYLPLTVSLSSGYLAILLDGGLFALSAFLYFLGGSLVRASRIAAKSANDEHTGMLTTTLAVCVVLAAMYAFIGTEVQIWVFFGLLANLCAAQAQNRHDREAVLPQRPVIGLANGASARLVASHALCAKPAKNRMPVHYT